MIGILFTGGTISMKLDPRTGAAVPAMGAADILAQVTGLGEVAEIEVEDFSRLPGPHVTPEQMWRLARRAAAWLDRPDVDGLVITHGTDTMEESAFLLDVLLTSPKPVVLVGAMRTVSDASWDGPANLLAAVRAAASPALAGHGVVIVMNDTILAAREARKVHTEASGAFASLEFGPLGIVDGGSVFLRRSPLQRPGWVGAGAEPGLRVGRIDPAVPLVQVYTGMDEGMLRAMVTATAPARGLAVIGFGRGNVPPAVVPPIRDAASRGLVVTVSSRSPVGRVAPRYGYEGGGLQLQQAGALLAGGLSGAKARLLIMAALGATGGDPARAREIVSETLELY
jgi:L-asparaginase